MRPRGESISSPRRRKVGQALRQRPQRTHFEVSSMSSTGVSVADIRGIERGLKARHQARGVGGNGGRRRGWTLGIIEAIDAEAKAAGDAHFGAKGSEAGDGLGG